MSKSMTMTYITRALFCQPKHSYQPSREQLPKGGGTALRV
jgi:hypothetical protein